MSRRILICDDEAGLREMISVLLRRAGHEVEAVDGVSAALERLGQAPTFDAVITDLVMPDGSGMQVLERTREVDPNAQVLMVTAFATTEQAVEAMRKGAYDYIQKPFKNSELLATLDKALEKRAIVLENEALRAEVTGSYTTAGVISKSKLMASVMQLVARAARTPTSVLLTGESGTGKEMVARALHALGERAENPFVVVNCGALPENLMESELFGHEKGAFTGAQTRSDGLFRGAHGGTLFLDEVAELPLPLQVKLLRALQERRVRPVGGAAEIEVDVRLIAATNRDVESEVAEGRFRQDLFYRLNVIRLHLPPLRDRPEDIPVLAEHFLAKHGALHKRQLTFSSAARHWLAHQTFPGNVRELENVIERAVALAPGSEIEPFDLGAKTEDVRAPVVPPTMGPDGLDLDSYLAELEKGILLDALERAGGVRTQAAKLLNMSFRSFRYRLAKYDLDTDEE